MINGKIYKKLLVRKAVLGDAKRMAELEKLCFKTPWSEAAIRREIEENPVAIYIIAELHGQVIGYAGVWWILDEGHITNVAVDPEYRDNKVATEIISGLIRVAEAEGVNKFTLEVRLSNEPALSLYRKFGFREVGLRKEYYEDNGEDAIIMWRKDPL